MRDISPTALQDLLRERGLTADALGVLGNCDKATAHRMATGQVKRPRPWTTVAIAKALGISPKRFESMVAAAYEAAHSDDEVPA
jgi:hypothetical protein